MPDTVRDRIERGNDYVASHIYALESRHVNELYAAYAQAYREMQAQMVSIFEQLAGGSHWSVRDLAARDALMQQIARRLLALDQLAAQQVLVYDTSAYQSGYYGGAYIMDSGIFEPLGMKPALIPMLPEMAIRAQILAPYEGQTFVERFADSRNEFVLRIKKSLVQSQIQGESVYQAQKRLADAMGIAISRRTKADKAANQGMFARTEMIARTELLRASNNGAAAIYQANDDVLSGWEFKTALDDRVCPTCAPLDGKVYAFGKGTHPPLHPRCRCTGLPVLRDKRLQNEIAGKRVTFNEWAAKRGLTASQYGQAYELRGKPAPQKAA